MSEPTTKFEQSSVEIQTLIHPCLVGRQREAERRFTGIFCLESNNGRLINKDPDFFPDMDLLSGRFLCAHPRDGFSVSFRPVREFGRSKSDKGPVKKGGRIDGRSVTGGPEHILVVDDDEAMVNVFKDILEHIGYRVTWRTSPEEALELFRSRPFYFDLVITDQRMPRMEGSELAGELLRIRPDTPIILCTGYSESISMEQAREIGFAAYILKPMGVETLADLIREVLDSRLH